LRSDRDHCASRVAVEQEEEEEDEEEKEEDEEDQATDIKSNNPHLAGGEKQKSCSKTPVKHYKTLNIGI